jgi:hypothetical protein
MGLLIFDRGRFIKVLINNDKANNASEQLGIRMEAWSPQAL